MSFLTKPTDNLLDHCEDATVLSHKAYAFDWRSFDLDLYPLLYAALTENDPTELETFIDDYRASLRQPGERTPLPADWRAGLENRDVHEYGDYALTLFYDPAEDWGLHEEWAAVSEALPESTTNALLGFTIGPSEQPFNPGRYVSCFQTAAQARESLAILQPLGAPELSGFVALLERCVAEGSGVYVTF